VEVAVLGLDRSEAPPGSGAKPSRAESGPADLQAAPFLLCLDSNSRGLGNFRCVVSGTGRGPCAPVQVRAPRLDDPCGLARVMELCLYG
jgi:hypothetical protein